MSGYLYPVVQPLKEKRARAQRLWAAGENEAGRKKRYREIWSAILQAESEHNNQQ